MSLTITKLLKDRILRIDDILNNTENYISIIKNVMIGIDPFSYEKYMNTVSNIRDMSKKLDASDITPRTIANIYEYLSLIDDRLKTLMLVIENETYIKLASKEMSTASIDSILAHSSEILKLYEKYLEIEIDNDNEITNEIIKLNAPEDLLQFIIDNEDLINKFTIRIIGHIIQFMKGDRKLRLEHIIEKQKDIVLGAKRLLLSGTGINGMMVRHGLIPLSSSMLLADLFELIGAHYKPKLSINDNLATLNVIVLNISNNSPIEFDLRGLIDINYIAANDLKTNPLSGLTKKILSRYNTTKMLKRSNNIGPILVFNNHSNNPWYILQTINGIHYRFIGPLVHDNYKVPHETAEQVLSGLSLRPHRYNYTQSTDILQRCFDTQADYITNMYLAEKSIMRSSTPIKNEIKDKYIDWFEKLITEARPTTMQQVKELSANKETITALILESLVHTISAHGRSPEYLISYIAKFDQIINTFIREFDRAWKADTTADRIFAELTGKDLYKYIVHTAMIVFQQAADELDKTDLWTDYDLSIKNYFLDHRQLNI